MNPPSAIDQNDDQSDLMEGMGATRLQVATVPRRSDLFAIHHSETTPSDRSIEKRRLRKHYVLNVIREQGPLSRAEAAIKSGFNLPSISSLVDELIGDGLVTENEARHAMRGRRPIPVMLCPNAASVLGIDLGKQTTTVLLADLEGKTLFSNEMSTPALDGPESYARWIVEAAESVFNVSIDTMPPLCGIGVALACLVPIETTSGSAGPAGMVDENSISAPEAVRQTLLKAYGVEVIVESNARIMVPGFQWFTKEKGEFRNYAVLNIGLGLGLGVNLNGQVMRGMQGFAGEIGHIPLGRPDVACYCGRVGCLENTASGAAISAMARQCGLPKADVEGVAMLARHGNSVAQDVFNAFAEALGKGVATIIGLINPEAVILAGKVTRASDLFFEPMMQSVKNHTLPMSLEKVRILVDNPDTNLSSLGAVAVVLHKIYYSSDIPFEEVI